MSQSQSSMWMNVVKLPWLVSDLRDRIFLSKRLYWDHSNSIAHNCQKLTVSPGATIAVNTAVDWSFERKTYTWLVFRFSKDLYLIMMQKLTLRISWNPPDFVQISGEICHVLCRFHEIWWISGEIQWISCRFSHEIRQISCEIHLETL